MNKDSLSALTIEQVIFHEIPRKIRGQEPSLGLSDEATPLAAKTRDHLLRRICGALGSSRASDIVFRTSTQSPVPKLIREYTQNPNPAHFVQMSREVAEYLYAMQAGVSPEGIVAVAACKSQGCQALAILKIEKEDGGRLTPEMHDGKRSFSYQVLDDLILTEGTKFFKNALFIRRGADGTTGDFEACACDNQTTGIAGIRIVAYFLDNFLGCQETEIPKVVTKRFFEVSQNFINDKITDAIARDDTFEHLRSQLKSESTSLTPRDFADNFLPLDLRQPYMEYLEEKHVPDTTFVKDIGDIVTRLRRKSIHTRRGITVIVPSTHEELVSISKDEDGQTVLTVRDEITRIDGHS